MNNLKKRDTYIQEAFRKDHLNNYKDVELDAERLNQLDKGEMVPLSVVKGMAWASFKKRDKDWAESEGGDHNEVACKKEFETWWKEEAIAYMSFKFGVEPVYENMLPRPYKTVKCGECGETVCDDQNKKIGHVYNKHNCKPSVDDYKAKSMVKKFFAKSIKESLDSDDRMPFEIGMIVHKVEHGRNGSLRFYCGYEVPKIRKNNVLVFLMIL